MQEVRVGLGIWRRGTLGFQETEKRSLLHLLRVRSGWEGEPGKGVRGCGTGRGGGEMTGVPRKAH
jgi:hypothetical protein